MEKHYVRVFDDRKSIVKSCYPQNFRFDNKNKTHLFIHYIGTRPTTYYFSDELRDVFIKVQKVLKHFNEFTSVSDIIIRV